MQDNFLRAHRLTIGALTALFFSFCLWAFLAKIDIVTTAQGKLIPSQLVHVAQPPEGGVVRTVLVKDGDQVTAGQPLLEMDAVYAEEDSASVEVEVNTLTARLERIDAELSGRPFTTADANVFAEYTSRRAAQEALIQEAMRQRESASSELQAARERRQKYTELAPIAARQADMLDKLKAQGFVSEAAHNDKLTARIEATKELDIQARAAEAAEANLRRADSSVQRLQTEYRKQLAVERADAVMKLAQAKSSLAKQTHRKDLQVLRAPVDGQVTGLNGVVPGRVVTAGAQLVSVVPKGDSLIFEGWVRNEDAAFVFPDMAAKVKMSAYPFQKYGWVEGELTWLGIDAETPESMKNSQGEPLYYRVRVRLSKQEVGEGGATHPLRPGMQSIADLQVGSRTLFEYMTSPLRKVALEAARER